MAAKVQISASKYRQGVGHSSIRPVDGSAITMGGKGTHSVRVMYSHNAAGSCESKSASVELAHHDGLGYPVKGTEGDAGEVTASTAIFDYVTVTNAVTK